MSGAESKAASLLAVFPERLTILRGMLKQCLFCPHFTSNVIESLLVIHQKQQRTLSYDFMSKSNPMLNNAAFPNLPCNTF